MMRDFVLIAASMMMTPTDGVMLRSPVMRGDEDGKSDLSPSTEPAESPRTITSSSSDESSDRGLSPDSSSVGSHDEPSDSGMEAWREKNAEHWEKLETEREERFFKALPLRRHRPSRTMISVGGSHDELSGRKEGKWDAHVNAETWNEMAGQEREPVTPRPRTQKEKIAAMAAKEAAFAEELQARDARLAELEELVAKMSGQLQAAEERAEKVGNPGPQDVPDVDERDRQMAERMRAERAAEGSATPRTELPSNHSFKTQKSNAACRW